jgi:hypothetical protein
LQPDVEGAYEALASRCPHSDLSFAGAVERLRRSVAATNGLPDRERVELVGAMADLQTTGHDCWLRLRATLCGQGIRIDEIDDIIIAAGSIPLKQTKPTQPFPSCEARHWDNCRASPG